jgi:hypothetical protein
MIINTSSTVAATSDIEKRIDEALQKASSNLSTERIEHLKAVKQRADALSSRGLLQRNVYSSSSSADFEKRYLLKKG